MASIPISVGELEKAAGAFVDEFSSGKIHRFPAELRDVGDRYIVPMVVAIGPYHRNSSHLQGMEKVKRAAALHFREGWEGKPSLEELQDAVLSVAGDARQLYAADAVVGMENHGFVEMMLLDACFLLQYMETYPSFRSNKAPRVDEALRRFLFANRACINNDIMLLENQLPWFVVKTIIDSLSCKKNYMDVVMQFIEDMGNTLSIDVDIVKREASGNSNWPPSYPPHLLDILRRSKIELSVDVDVEWPQVDRISPFSAIELAEIGIKLKASKTALFTDMDVRKRGPLCGELSMAPLSLNDTTACWLVNMAVFEIATASTFFDPNTTAVCSYLALLSMFLHREEDVHYLRSKRILGGHQINADMLTFFKMVMKLLPDTGCRFAHIMLRIQEYKESRWIRTRAHKYMYSNRWTIIRVATIIRMVTTIGTLLGIFQALVSLNQGQKS